MPANPNAYLVQLRGQISSTFDLEELKVLAFELGLDWDELQGNRKTIRIQDLITQLAHQGRLESLVETLQQLRPHIFWPEVPPPNQQQQDIRAAFPTKPLYQQTWVWGLTIALLIIISFAIFMDVPQKITDYLIPAIEPEVEGETLIIISRFAAEVGEDSLIHTKIRDEIEAKVNELNRDDVRVGIVKTPIDVELNLADQRLAAQQIGDSYQASMIIWGVEAKSWVTFNFLNLIDPEFDAAQMKIQELDDTQLANPEGYGQFVVKDLPGQLSFLSLFTLGQAEYYSNNWDEAIRLIETAVKSLPELTTEEAKELEADSAYFRLGWLYQNRDRISEAMTNYNHTIAINPKHIHAHNNLGNAYDSLEEYEKAIEYYDNAIALDQTYFLAFYNQGNAHKGLEQFEQAIADYNEAIALNPNYFQAYTNRGNAYRVLEDYEKAIEDFTDSIDINPNDYKAFYSRGRSHDSLKQYEAALEDYNQAVLLEPTYYQALARRGYLLGRQERYEEALTDLNQAIDFNREYADAYLYRAHVYKSSDRPVEALADFRHYLELYPGSPYRESIEGYIRDLEFELGE